MSEYTSLDVSKRLADAGFDIGPPDGMWEKRIIPLVDGKIDETYMVVHFYWTTSDRRCYRADTLEDWLMTKPFFSRRAATIQIAYRAVKVGEALDPISDTSVRQDEKWVGHYFVTALNGSGHEVGQGESASRSDALAEVVLKVLAVSITKEEEKAV